MTCKENITVKSRSNDSNQSQINKNNMSTLKFAVRLKRDLQGPSFPYDLAESSSNFTDTNCSLIQG